MSTAMNSWDVRLNLGRRSLLKLYVKNHIIRQNFKTVPEKKIFN
jgi:hypothetical protein